MAMKEEMRASEKGLNLNISKIYDDIRAMSAGVPLGPICGDHIDGGICSAGSHRATYGFEEDHIHTSDIPNFTPPVANRVEESDNDQLNENRVRRPSVVVRNPYTVPRQVKVMFYA
ncbi:hypothetical protein LWI28_028763 [Acer negundo]|uniref:Uncharacterized protein n=1 Tax=Acer negundo TaxID=4023 RepID=A0AAD5JEY7_ACENE|nr:hypothetical protein LWI28_028763 [Acer negundo]